jgi:hypothetical protein
VPTGHFRVVANPARNPKFLAFDNKTCLSPFRYSAQCRSPSELVVRSQLGLDEACMRRDDLFFWLSLIWFVGVCGAAIWVYF